MFCNLSSRSAVIAAATGILALEAGSASAATRFRAILEGAQEVPAVVSPFTGIAELELIDLGGGDYSLAFELQLPAGLDYQFLVAGAPVADIPTDNLLAVRQLHIHNGPRGVNAPVVYGVYNPDQDVDNDVVITVNPDGSALVTGSWGPTDGNPVGNINGFAQALRDAKPGEDVDFDWNLHTIAFPSGEIRGQIFAVPAPATLALFGLGLVAFAAGRKRG